MSLRLCLALLFLSFSAFTQELDEAGIFSARVSKVNPETSLVRFRVDFSNFRYLNKKDKVEFWVETTPSRKCQGTVIGKSNDYMLIKVAHFEDCSRKASIAAGAYLRFFSQDLVNNIRMGKELMEVLVKKRLALNGQLSRQKVELDKHIEKVSAVNERYRVLREKLEAEWRDEIANVEHDRSATLKRYNDFLIQLQEVDAKIEQYKVTDQNLKEDRWSLDSRLYYKK